MDALKDLDSWNRPGTADYERRKTEMMGPSELIGGKPPMAAPRRRSRVPRTGFDPDKATRTGRKMYEKIYGRGKPGKPKRVSRKSIKEMNDRLDAEEKAENERRRKREERESETHTGGESSRSEERSEGKEERQERLI